jgi:uncharacterized damage-inducible protein DinB
MKETHRIASLFEKLYDGDPWIDINIFYVLQRISAKQANKRVLPNCNTIWELTNHIICWRQNVLLRVQGKVLTTPDHNYFEPIKNSSPNAWDETLLKLEQSQEQWLAFLDACKQNSLERQYPVNEMTYYEHIQGILQHDAYHLGQIVLLAKQL